MTLIPVDDKTLAALTGPNELLAVTDAAGKVVGFFCPVGFENAPNYAAASAHFYPTKDVRSSDGPRYTTAEVVSHLKSLENP